MLTVSATLKARAILAGSVDSAIETAIFQLNPLPSGLDLYFPFNETSGSAFTDTVAGVTAGCVSCPTPVSGRVSGAQQYDGIGNAVDVPDVGLFDWATTDRFSLEAWVNKSAACIGSESIVGRHETGSQLHWWLGCENGIAAFTLTDSGGTGATILGTTDIADGQWHHLVAVRDAISGEIRLYVDGVEEAAAAVAYTADFAGAAELNIGWLNDTATDYHFAGTIDELALHSRVLTPAEISRHYKDGTVGLRRGVWGCESPVAIMPLGDSITNMQGYRPQLYFDLVDAGYNVDFVGTRTDSTGTHDRNHEGHGGITISGVAASLNTWLTQNPPDAVLLHIGTNEDPSFPYPSAAGVEDLHTIIDAFDPNISIVQARIINKVPNEPLVTQFNDNVVAMAAARVANGENITIADHESALNYIDDMNNDGIHPLQVGFDKMVPVWFEQLAAFLPACNQTLPQTTSQAITTAEVGVPYAYQLETRGYPSPEFSLLTAPAGMTIHPDTGNIDWVPTATGSFDISVQVENAAGAITHDFTISVTSLVDSDFDGITDDQD
ncbi:MAG: LamG-like jellyroll fold domain-containing protein, partial [Gammaproteobacteria bacterium]